MTGIRLTPGLKAFVAHNTAMIFIFALLFVPSVTAQDDHYEKIFTTENGLPHNHVLSIAEDKTGFLWIGTWDGLSRFDGYEFKNYHHEPDNPSSIPYFICRKICVDRYNNLWIYHVGNVLSRYNRNTDNFRDFSMQFDSVLKKTGINDITTDAKGNLFVSGNRHVAIFDSASGSFKNVTITIKADIIIPPDDLYTIRFDNRRHIWLSTNDYFLMGEFNPDSNEIIITHHFPFLPDGLIPKPNSYTTENHFTTLEDGSFWLFSNSGLREIPTGKYTVNLPSNVDRDSNFYWYRAADKIHTISSQGDLDIELKAGEYPQTLFIDRSGTVWYCTLFGSGMGTGLHRYNKTPGYFKHYLPEVNHMPSVVHTVAKDDKGNLLIGTEASNYISCISENGSITRLNVFNNELAFRYEHLRSLLPVKGGIYAGYMKERLDFFDYTTREFSNIALTEDNTYLREPYGFRTLLKDTRGTLIIGSMGLFRFAPDDTVKFGIIWQNVPPGKGIYSLAVDSHGTIWAGSGSDVLKISENYLIDTIYSISNAIYNIEDICFDSNDKMWLALLGGGLLQFDPDSGKNKFYTTADGLSNNTTYSILKDNNGNLWITTDNGISRFNTKTKKFRIFGPTDGLKIHEFNSDAAFLDEKGRMYFGGMGGVVSFHPDSIMDKDTRNGKSRLIITEFRVSGLPRYFDKPIYETGLIKLNKGDDNFGLTFACLDFKNAEKIKYRYRIHGYTDKWTEVDYLHRRINIAGLDPDTYTLELQSTDIYGDWNNSLNLRIKIPPLFYETKAFLVSLIIFMLALIVLFVVVNNRQIRIKEGQKQQYLKLESIRGQMNPHFIFNSLNSINYFIANNDRLAANRYISNFSKLIRSFLSNMSQEYISLSDEIASLEDYMKLEFLRFSDKFDYSISFESIEIPEKWEVFPGMVQPFVENAIWHGVRGLQDRKGFITISFSENGGIQCSITDDGIGRHLAAKNVSYHEKKKSRGIGLIFERMHLINHIENKNYAITINDLYSDREECGTKIQIEIPSRLKLKSKTPVD